MSTLDKNECDIKFDYNDQVYKNSQGETLEEQEGWDFPCPKCYSPATLTDISVYYEHHVCISCKHEFDVS